MPGPWRQMQWLMGHLYDFRFQSRPRCQAPGDGQPLQGSLTFSGVSISTEMPGPWRLAWDYRPKPGEQVSISTEMPGPWRRSGVTCVQFPDESFNLDRDARPLATNNYADGICPHCQFQS